MKKLISGNTFLMGAAMTAVLFTSGCNEEKAAPSESDTSAKASAQDSGTGSEVVLESNHQKLTYIVGYNMATQAKSNGVEFEVDVIAQAINDVNAGKESRFSKEEEKAIFMAFQEKLQEKRKVEMEARQAEQAKKGEENKVAGEAYLKENSAKEGVKVTDSGLQYRVISSGEEGAASPTLEDTVEVHYHGTLTDGTVFDSSVEKGNPISFAVTGVIKGWTEGLQLMKIGDKFEFVIPSDLAYGPSGGFGKIGPNEVLKFEVELLQINPDVAAHHGGGHEGHGHAEPAAAE